MEWGSKEDFLERQAKKGVKFAKETWDSRVVVESHFEDVWNAFNELHRVRQCGFGINAIAYNDIEAWLNIHNIYDQDERLYYYNVIIQVDSEFVSWAREREERERKSKPSIKRK